MKNEICYVTFVISTFFSGIFIGSILTQKWTPQVDLPEEWRAVTNNESKPDTMLVYKHGNKLFFGFTGKHR